VFAEHLLEPEARDAAAVYWVLCVTLLAWTWLFKWSIGRNHGQVDARLEPSYVSRLYRRYPLFALLNAVAAAAVLVHWPLGLAFSALLTISLLFPPETPRYFTEAPIVEGES
jgi:hypothetical protein